MYENIIMYLWVSVQEILISKTVVSSHVIKLRYQVSQLSSKKKPESTSHQQADLRRNILVQEKPAFQGNSSIQPVLSQTPFISHYHSE